MGCCRCSTDFRQAIFAQGRAPVSTLAHVVAFDCCCILGIDGDTHRQNFGEGIFSYCSLCYAFPSARREKFLP